MLKLNSSSRVPKPIVAVLARATKTSLVLLLVCAVYTFYAFSEAAVEQTRISENALLPGLVDDGFVDAAVIARHISNLRQRANNRSELLDYIYDELRSSRIETYSQKFAAKHTLVTNRNSTSSHGQNIYGIVRAPRHPPFESILVAVSVDKTRLASTAFALALASYAKKQIYWARDVVFLFVDGHNVAAEAWLSAFSGSKHAFIDADELKARAGPIIGAFVLDFSDTEEFRAINIKYGMINGRLPNLDLVNLFVLLVEKYGGDPTLYHVAHNGGQRASYSHATALVLFARTVISQSFTETEGLHSILGGYGVNALTLQAAGREDDFNADEEPLYGAYDSGNTLSVVELARVAESGMRSLNNIVEKLHRSYFLYFLAHTHRFVSVAFYMPIIGFLLAPMLFFALRDWIRLKNGDKAFDFLRQAGDDKKVAEEMLVYSGPTEIDILNSLFSILLMHAVSLIFYACVIMLCSLTAHDLLLSAASYVKCDSMTAFIGCLSNPVDVFGAVILLPSTIISPLVIYFGQVRNDSNYYFLRFITACEIALLFGALSLLNFSLAFALSLLFVPFATFALATDKNSSPLVKLIGFGVFNPFSVACSIALILERSGVATFGGISTFNLKTESARALWKRLIRWVALITRNHFIHSSALLPILFILCLTISHALIHILIYENHDKDTNVIVRRHESDNVETEYIEAKKSN